MDNSTTVISITPNDDVMAIIDAFGGPGTEFVFTPGDYSQEIVLRGEVANHNGVIDKPMRLILSEGATLNAESGNVDTIRFAAASYVTLEGEGKINGAGSNSKQAVHIHSAPKKGLYSTGLKILGLHIFPIRGDGIKASETIDLLIDGVEVDGRYLESGTESLIDCNKFKNVTIRDCSLINHPRQHALVLKGGGVGAFVERVFIDNVMKGIEIGGYEGSGYWDQIDNQWAAKDVVIRDSNIGAIDYPIRFIDAHNVTVENTPMSGKRAYLVTNSKEVNRGDYECSNIMLNGELIVASINGEATPTPVSTPVPDPVEPTPAPAPAPEPAPMPEPAPAPAPVDAEYTYVKGDSVPKDTVKTVDHVVPTIALKGFTADEVESGVKEKSPSLVIIDLRKSDGPRLVIKGKGARDTWRSSVTVG